MTSPQQGNGNSNGNAPGQDAGQNFFLVHLQSLTDFARELETQVGAIRTPTQSLSGLATHPMALGEFGEGHGLHARHQAAAAEIHQVLESARGAIEFAGDVTDVIASSYQRFDDHVADLYSGNGTPVPTKSGYEPVGDAGQPGNSPANPPNPNPPNTPPST